MSAVIFKQRFLHENEIVQYIWNYKCYDVNQGHFRKPLQSSANIIKISILKLSVHFSWAVQVLATFNVQIVITLAFFWQNHSNYLFSKASQTG